MLETSLIPASTVGVDASVFILHFAGRSAEATEFLRQVEARVFRAVTTREVMFEVLHRLMVLEAVGAGLVGGGNPARALKNKPEAAKQLKRYCSDVSSIGAMGLTLLPPLPDPIRASQRFRQEYGLLSNDSLFAATLAANGIDHLVTADKDFDRLNGVHVVRLRVD
jgi:predicted nucleic acid-binding protein